MSTVKSKSATLCPVSKTGKVFLLRLYALMRVSEMPLALPSGQQTESFRRTPSEAQTKHRRKRCPQAEFDLIKLDQQPIGRLYAAELEDEIRGIDLAFLPYFYNRSVYDSMFENVLKKAARRNKSVRIRLEYNHPQT